MTDCRIIILNYNGRDLLKECLPSIRQAAMESGCCRVTVLDNQSTDDSEETVRQGFPDIEFVMSGSNRVFCSYNALVAATKEKYVILLNNDIRVEKDFAAPLITALDSDPAIFFVAPKTLNYSTNEYEGGLAKLEFRWGLLWGASKFGGFERKIDRPGLTMQCGFGAFRKDVFVKLGGYDDLYLPGTVEDSDLCFRAYRQGFKGYYCPQSIVYHRGQVSFKKAFGISGIRRLNRRNLYLFVWKNIHDPYLLARHLLTLPLQLVTYLFRGQIDFLSGFKDALGLLPVAIQKRNTSSKEPSVLSDNAIFSISRSL